MFVDVFPLKNGVPGPPLNVATRKAKEYFLRVIIWNTAEVPPDETSITGEEMSDLYLKGTNESQILVQLFSLKYLLDQCNVCYRIRQLPLFFISSQ